MDFIMFTSNEHPMKTPIYTGKSGFTGVYIIFLILAQKHRLCVQVRTPSVWGFQRVPTIHFWSKNKENRTDYQLKNDIPRAMKVSIILHMYVILMLSLKQTCPDELNLINRHIEHI